MTTIRIMNDKVQVKYDKASDVLYLSFGNPVNSITEDQGWGLLRREEKTGLISGITIVDAKNKLWIWRDKDGKT